jgi:hypothetical protein
VIEHLIGPYYPSYADGNAIQPGVDFLIAITAVFWAACFAAPRKDILALVPKKTWAGDKVAVFCGGHVPFVLRSAGKAHTGAGQYEQYQSYGGIFEMVSMLVEMLHSV